MSEAFYCRRCEVFTLGPCACTINACSGGLLPKTERHEGHSEIEAMLNRLAEAGRKHWEEFHLHVWTLEQLAAWESRIPNEYGCDCPANYRNLKELCTNPVLSPAWKVELHNRINAKLGKKEFTLEEAFNRWGELYAKERNVIASCCASQSCS